MLKTKVYRSPGSGSLQTEYLSVLSGMPISTVNVHKSTPAQCRSWWLFCRGINNSLTLLESWHLPPSSLSLAGQAHESCPRDYSSLPAFLLSSPSLFFSPFSHFTHLPLDGQLRAIKLKYHTATSSLSKLTSSVY